MIIFRFMGTKICRFTFSEKFMGTKVSLYDYFVWESRETISVIFHCLQEDIAKDISNACDLLAAGINRNVVSWSSFSL